jgi:hypothetical protein
VNITSIVFIIAVILLVAGIYLIERNTRIDLNDLKEEKEKEINNCVARLGITRAEFDEATSEYMGEYPDFIFYSLLVRVKKLEKKT